MLLYIVFEAVEISGDVACWLQFVGILVGVFVFFSSCIFVVSPLMFICIIVMVFLEFICCWVLLLLIECGWLIFRFCYILLLLSMS